MFRFISTRALQQLQHKIVGANEFFINFRRLGNWEKKKRFPSITESGRFNLFLQRAAIIPSA